MPGKSLPRIEAECNTHGIVTHVQSREKRAEGDVLRWRCTKCRYAAVKKRRAVMKAQLVALLGGKCQRCGYDDHIEALEFHHRNPAGKDFQISGKANISWDRLSAEAQKCDLLCANCHRIVHYELRLDVP